MSRTYTPVFGPVRSLCPNGLPVYIWSGNLTEFINPQNMLFQSQTQYYKNYARKAVSHKDQKLQSYYRETMEKKEVYK